MSFWTNKRVVITGGSGFLGSFVVDKLKKLKPKEMFIPRSKEYDLRKIEDIKKMLNAFNPNIIIHLAATVGGIYANRLHPAEFFYDNLTMGINLIHESYLFGVDKFVALGTVCAYPKFTPVPFKEENLWNGYPEETNAPYGLAKKMLLVQSQAYREQYDFNSIFLLPVNLYGPRDNFDLESSHVIPALIRKCLEAKQHKDKTITAWGTGSATREFLYVEDAAEAIILAAEQYNKSDPINIGSSMEISITEFLNLIMKYTGFECEIIWDSSKPDGQPRRCLDTTKAMKEFDFKAKTKFEDGLKQTVEWYINSILE